MAERQRQKGGGGGDEDTDLSAVTAHLSPGDKDVVMQALGYKGVWKPTLIKSDACKRCGKKVYPVEKVSLGAGIQYHRACFRCRTCSTQLTMQTFQREVDPDTPSDTKEIYCKQHVPVQSRALMDYDAFGIRSAVDAQKAASRHKRIQHNQQPPPEGWQYDSQALEFQRAKDKKEIDDARRKKHRRASLRRKSSLKLWKELKVSGVFEAQTKLEEEHRKEEDELYRQIYEDRQKHVDHLQRQMDDEKTSKIRRLIEYFEAKGMSQGLRDHTLKKVERFFKSLTEQRMDLLKKRLAVEEKGAVARMIERQSQEMLGLIASKEKEIEDKMKTDAYNNLGIVGEEKEADKHLAEEEDLSDVTDSDSDGSHHSESNNAENIAYSEDELATTATDRDNGKVEPNSSKDMKAPKKKNEEGDQSDISVDFDSPEEDDDALPPPPDTDFSEVTKTDKTTTSFTDDTLDELISGQPSDVHGLSVSDVDSRSKSENKGMIKDRSLPTTDDFLDEFLSDHQGDDEDLSPGIDSDSMRRPDDSKYMQPPLPVVSGGPTKSADAAGLTQNIDEQNRALVSPQPGSKASAAGISPAKEVQYMVFEKLQISPQTVSERSKVAKTIVFQPVNQTTATAADLGRDNRLLSNKIENAQEIVTKPANEQFYLKSSARKSSPPDEQSSVTQKAKGGANNKAANNVESPQSSATVNPSPATEVVQLQGSPGTRRKSQQQRSVGSNTQDDSSAPQRSSAIKPQQSTSTKETGTPRSKNAASGSVESPRNHNRSTDSSHRHRSKDHHHHHSRTQSPAQGVTEIAVYMDKTPTKDKDRSMTPSGSGKHHNKSAQRGSTPKPTRAEAGGGKTKRKSAEEEEEEEDSSSGDNDDVTSVAQAPKVKPAKVGKAKLVSDPKVFKDLDTRAIAETKKELTTFTDLVRRLAAKCNTELEKVRAIFRWITAKDLNQIEFSEKLNPNTPMGLLRGIKYGTESYHDLFKRLCSYAGLHCEIIDGYSKGLGYRPGMPLKGNKFRNQWTAVSVDGSWRFVNCNWGARHVKSTNDQLPTYAVDEFYFLTDAEDHIYQHFPDNAQWQLLKQPLTLDEFIRLPVVKSPFFNHKLSFSTKRPNCVLQTTSGRVQLRISAPKLYKFNCSFQSVKRSVDSEALLERCYTRTVNNDLVVTAVLPATGYYYLDVYVSRHWSGSVTHNACSFLVKCAETYSGAATLTFPQEETTYGATPAMRHHGISPMSHVDSYISCAGELQVKFGINSDAKLGHNLFLWNGPEKRYIDYTKYACLTYRGETDAAFSVQFPKQGLYVLRCLTGEADERAPRDNLDCFFRYLVHCKSPKSNAVSYPKVSKKMKGIALLKPLAGHLVANSVVAFQLDSPSAVAVAVVIGAQWSHLQRKDTVWEGNVRLPQAAKKATICAKFNQDSDKFQLIAEYKIT